MDFPDRLTNVAELEDWLSRPTPAAVAAMRRLSGDLLLLGVGGKMGPTLARMARRASDEAGISRRIIGVSRFSQPVRRDLLESCGIETRTGDLLDEDFLQSLPPAENVIFMTGMKFGTQTTPWLTWAMNSWVPALVCRKYADSRILAFSSGNVYGYVPPHTGGSRESDPLRPVGEYANSVLGRERIIEYFSRRCGTPVVLLRLNYACELRYGVLVDLARQVNSGTPVDVSMGHVNVIWQGDANAMALAALADAQSPPQVLNVAGPECLPIRDLAERLGQRLGVTPSWTGSAAGDALLSNSSQACQRYGVPQVSVERMICWIADWFRRQGELWDKPTHFQDRDGGF